MTGSEQGKAWYAKNRERHLAKMKAYRAANLEARREYDRRRWREQRDEMRAKERARHAKDKERRNARRRARAAADRAATNAEKRAYYAANTEACKASASRSRKKHAARVLAKNAMRRARLKGASVVERVNRAAIFERDRGLCRLCGRPVDPKCFHLDHWIPLARGGHHAAGNVFVAHPRCNIRKRDRLMPEIGG